MTDSYRQMEADRVLTYMIFFVSTLMVHVCYVNIYAIMGDTYDRVGEERVERETR